MSVSPVPPDQLEAGLVAALPELDLDGDWRAQRRLWGHAFHPLCTYLGSFPASLAHAFISVLSRPGDAVLDPFSGRGTTALQACVEGRVGVGSDLNPLAWLLTAAKVDAPSRADVDARLARLRVDWSRAHGRDRGGDADDVALRGRPVPDVVRLAFDPGTLRELVFVREALDLGERTDRLLLAALTGIVHGRGPGFLTDVMPNAFSMPPGYVARFSAASRFAPPARQVLPALAAKVGRLYRDGPPPVRGLALQGDARAIAPVARRELRARALPDRARLVLMSPPYLRLVRYGAQNWLRHWLLGTDPTAVDGASDAHRADRYGAFMTEVLHGLREVLTDDAVVVIVLGDIAADGGRRLRTSESLAERVWHESAAPLGYRLVGVARDRFPAQRRSTRLWAASAGRATEGERILVLAPTELGRRRALPSLRAPVDWRWPPAAKGPASILRRDAADVSPGRSGGHGSARPDEEPRPRPHDQPSPELHPPAAGAPVRA